MLRLGSSRKRKVSLINKISGETKKTNFLAMARHDDLPVPVYKSLEPVYGTGSQLEEAELRFNTLKSKFVEVFGHSPDIYARSPGTVCSTALIGL